MRSPSLSPSQPAAALSRKRPRCPGHPLSLELRLLGHDVLLQLLHVFELLLAETLRWLVLLLLRREDQLRRHRCHVVLARISAGEQVVVLAPLRLRVLGCLVARGNRLLEKLAGLSLYFRRRAGQGYHFSACVPVRFFQNLHHIHRLHIAYTSTSTTSISTRLLFITGTREV